MFSFFCFAFLFFRCLNWCVHSFLLSLLSNIQVLIPPLQSDPILFETWRFGKDTTCLFVLFTLLPAFV